MTNKPQPPSAFFNVSMSPDGIRLERGGSSILMTAQEWEEISGEVSKIIFDDMRFTSDTFLSFFKENGIYSESAWNVFYSVVGDKYTKQDMEEIIKATTTGFETFQDLIEFSKRGAMKIGKIEMDMMKKVLAEKEQILDRARKHLK